MKEKLTRNISLKILSIILAAMLWLVITNVDDPISPASYNNVPVKIINVNAIDTSDTMYEIVEGSTIDFSFAARRSIIEDIALSDFEVTADFAKLSNVNAVTIDIKCAKYGSDITITDGLYQVMKINLEEILYKNFKVTVVSKGEPEEGYYIGEKTASTIISVSGPKSKIERINEIVAEVNVAGASESFNSYEKLKALDKEGKEIDSSNLTLSQSYVSLNIKIYETKEIGLRITTVGDPLPGYVVSAMDYEPKTIEVAGKDEILNSIQELVIEEDISGAKEIEPKEIKLQEELGEGLLLVGDDQTAVVNITIEKAETKEITIWPGDIEVKNIPTDMELTYVTTGPISLKIVGPADELKELNRNAIKPFIDLKDYAYGTYAVKIQITPGVYSDLAESPNVSVYLTSKLSGSID